MMADTSTPADRKAFTDALEGAAPGPAMLALAAVVENSLAPMPDTTAYLLDLPARSTFAQGVALMRARIAAGQRPL